MNWRARGTALVVLVCASACQHGPTRVTESRERPYAVLAAKARVPIEVTEQTVVLDARGAFEFGLNRVQRAVHFPWDRLAERRDTGETLRDLRRAGERLALAGVTPETPVVIVGDGTRGAGEEGRLAWSLVRFGVRDVQVTSNESLRRLWTQAPPTEPKNVPGWTPAARPEFELDERGFHALAGSLSELKVKRTWLVDVRAEREYLEGQSIPGSLNVPWTEFYGADGRPSVKITARLAGVDVRPADRVILISPRGVRAGAAAYALLTAGFAHVQVYRRR